MKTYTDGELIKTIQFLQTLVKTYDANDILTLLKKAVKHGGIGEIELKEYDINKPMQDCINELEGEIEYLEENWSKFTDASARAVTLRNAINVIKKRMG